MSTTTMAKATRIRPSIPGSSNTAATDMQPAIHTPEYVRLAVLNILGHPPKMELVKCINVFGNHWRVNVFCKRMLPGAAWETSFMPHTFFLTFDKEGNLEFSDPKIERVYEQ